VRSLAIGDYVPEEKILPNDVSRFLLDGRWRGSPVSERVSEGAGIKTFQAAQDRYFWEPLAALRLPLLVIRSGDSILVGDDEWSRYKAMFPQAQLVEFGDSPHDIFRPDRGRYPQLVQEHVDRADRDR
jgi:pimeloyl-ACP methyl ester carboxylesterase